VGENHQKEAKNHLKEGYKHFKEWKNHFKEGLNHLKERNNHPKELVVSLKGAYDTQRLTPNLAKYYLQTYIVNNNIYTATKSPLSKGDLGGLAATSAARNNCPP